MALFDNRGFGGFGQEQYRPESEPAVEPVSEEPVSGPVAESVAEEPVSEPVAEQPVEPVVERIVEPKPAASRKTKSAVRMRSPSI